MIRVGVIRGRENSFPEAIIERINSANKDVHAEFAMLGGTTMNEPSPFRVILDRLSHEVPYYSAHLKMAVLQGTYVINDPWLVAADDKFFGYSVAQKLGMKVPKTVLLPSVQFVDDITPESLRNLWPVDLAGRLEEVGCPCYLKPAYGGGWKMVNKINSLDELRYHYSQCGQTTMVLQEYIKWDEYIRCICIGQEFAKPIQYRPAPYGRGEYVQDSSRLDPALAKEAARITKEFTKALHYDMNALEWAVKDGELYGIDLTNHVCDMDYKALKDAHFDWAVSSMVSLILNVIEEDRKPLYPQNLKTYMVKGA